MFIQIQNDKTEDLYHNCRLLMISFLLRKHNLDENDKKESNQFRHRTEIKCTIEININILYIQSILRLTLASFLVQ